MNVLQQALEALEQYLDEPVIVVSKWDKTNNAITALRKALEQEPKREWVGLTDDEKKLINIGARYHWEMTTQEYANLIQAMTEAKLKEKNNG